MQRKQEEISKDGEERRVKTKQYYRVINIRPCFIMGTSSFGLVQLLGYNLYISEAFLF